MDRRTLPALLAATVALGALLLPPPGVPESPLLGQTCEPAEGERLFFAMSIADEQGTVLAEPKLLGMCGLPVEMTLADPGNADEPRMSLLLEPFPARDGTLDIAFEVSVPGRVEGGRGHVRVRPGEERTAEVKYPGGTLQIQLAAFQVNSPEFRLYLEHGRAVKRARPGRT